MRLGNWKWIRDSSTGRDW